MLSYGTFVSQLVNTFTYITYELILWGISLYMLRKCLINDGGMSVWIHILYYNNYLIINPHKYGSVI